MKALSHGISNLPIEWRSEHVTSVIDAPNENDEHMEAIRAEILRVARSISNPVYRHGFEMTMNKALNDDFNGMEPKSSKSDCVEATSSRDEEVIKTLSEHRLGTYKTRRKLTFNYQHCKLEQFFGTIYVEKEISKIWSCQSDNSGDAPDSYQYMHQTTFDFHPAW